MFVDGLHCNHKISIIPRIVRLGIPFYPLFPYLNLSKFKSFMRINLTSESKLTMTPKHIIMHINTHPL